MVEDYEYKYINLKHKIAVYLVMMKRELKEANRNMLKGQNDKDMVIKTTIQYIRKNETSRILRILEDINNDRDL